MSTEIEQETREEPEKLPTRTKEAYETPYVLILGRMDLLTGSGGPNEGDGWGYSK